MAAPMISPASLSPAAYCANAAAPEPNTSTAATPACITLFINIPFSRQDYRNNYYTTAEKPPPGAQ